VASTLRAGIAIVGLLVCGAAPAAAAVVSPGELAAWRGDLGFVARELPRVHPNAFHSTSRAGFESALDSLAAAAPALSSHQLMMGLARVIAAIGDGHTRLTLPLAPGIEFFQGHASTPPPILADLTVRQYPIRLHALADGVFVHRVERAQAWLAGARLIGVGRLGTDQAIAVMSEVVERDNEVQARALAVQRLALADVVHALGIVDDVDRAPFRFVLADGREVSAEFRPVPAGGTVEWSDARPDSIPPPLGLRDTGRNFWFEYLPDSRTVYFAYNEVNDGPDETLERFAGRLFSLIEEQPVDRLVIDLRHNGGGDNGLNLPLLHGLIRCEAVRRPGALYAIVGRGTFSAAMMFALDLERHTRAIFVGEPTGARPNHYGDARLLRLPGTGLTVRVSTLYWQYSDPRDERSWIAPHIAAPLTSAAYCSGRDPAMAAILAGLDARPAADAVAGTWAGPLRFGHQSLDAEFRFRRTRGGWAGEVDVPAAGLAASPLRITSATPARIEFDWKGERSALTFSGRLQGARMLLLVNRRGSTVPLVLERRP
jgi:hypothetical protein